MEKTKKIASKKTNIHAGTYKGITMANMSGLIAQYISLLQPIYINNDQILLFQGLFWHTVRSCSSKIDWELGEKYPSWYSFSFPVP